MAEVRIDLEINAAPAEVRAVFLDFTSYPEWHTAFIKSLTPISPANSSSDLSSGDKIRAVFKGSTVDVTLVSNTQTDFRWRGSAFIGAFAGEHYFQFLESKITDGGCTLVHGEHYDGWMSWLFGEGLMGLARSNVMTMYEGFSKDLKRRVEELTSANRL